MMIFEELDKYVAGRLFFPSVNSLLNRRNILGKYQELKESEQYSEEALRNLQLRKLIVLLKDVYARNPYYATKFREIGFVPEDILSLDDVKQFPPLSRKDVIDHHHEMVDNRYRSAVLEAEESKKGPGEPLRFARFRKNKLIWNTSTGSTGTPTTFYEDGSTTALNWAHEMRWKRWYGFDPGVKEARMARVSADYIANSKMLRMRKQLWRQLILPGMNLTDTHYEICLSKITKFQPRILFGITSAIFGLADYIRRSGREECIDFLGLIITWAAPLHDHERKLLEEVFSCPVSNIYSAREVGHVAAICPQGSLHINQENYLLEIEEPSGSQTNNGIGEVLITTLFPSPMPFIRYRIGDVGEFTSNDCSCGRSHQVLKGILGRTGEVHYMKDGRMISPNFWCRGFMSPLLSQCVERFQVIYQRDDIIRLRIVRKDNYTADAEAEIRGYVENNFHSNTQYELEYVPIIDLQPSGKYQLVIDESNEHGITR